MTMCTIEEIEEVMKVDGLRGPCVLSKSDVMK